MASCLPVAEIRGSTSFDGKAPVSTSRTTSPLNAIAGGRPPLKPSRFIASFSTPARASAGLPTKLCDVEGDFSERRCWRIRRLISQRATASETQPLSLFRRACNRWPWAHNTVEVPLILPGSPRSQTGVVSGFWVRKRIRFSHPVCIATVGVPAFRNISANSNQLKSGNRSRVETGFPHERNVIRSDSPASGTWSQAFSRGICSTTRSSNGRACFSGCEVPQTEHGDRPAMRCSWYSRASLAGWRGCPNGGEVMAHNISERRRQGPRTAAATNVALPRVGLRSASTGSGSTGGADPVSRFVDGFVPS